MGSIDQIYADMYSFKLPEDTLSDILFNTPMEFLKKFSGSK